MLTQTHTLIWYRSMLTSSALSVMNDVFMLIYVFTTVYIISVPDAYVR